MPGITAAYRMPVTVNIHVAGARPCIVTVNINISSSVPGPFAGYPIGTGIRGRRSYVNGFGWLGSYIIITCAGCK
jgi:hypothetical protein